MFLIGNLWKIILNLYHTEIGYESRDKKGLLVIDNDLTYCKDDCIPDWDFMENYIKSLPYGDKA
jgi:hypothetical protein